MASILRIVPFVLAGVSQSNANIQQLRGSSKQDFAKLGGAMQPTVAAHTLSMVENEWRSQALLFAECQADGHSDCERVQSNFQKSCGTVVTAVVAASSGDRDTVNEYMGVVCDEPELKDWKHERCQSFARAISSTMTADSYENRERLNTQSLCFGFWANMSSEEGARAAQERAWRAKRMEVEHELVAKQAREAAQALADATAARKAQMASEAKRRMIEEKRRAIEEQHRRQVAERAAREAKLAAERTAVAKERSAKHAAQKAANEAKIRQRREAARKAAEAQAAEADAKLAQAESEEQETRRRIADVEATKQKPHEPQSPTKVEVAPYGKETVKAAKVVHAVQAVVATPHPEKTQQALQPHAAFSGKQATKNKK
mmetsp:Transcript_8579/g.16224  ORF Transcript_8579/g.16224 Transcript_8579/m.16224 type:complete len:374 (-) Transcript_8579:58-1179(-)